MPELKRVACFIDGFNLYHAIHDLSTCGTPKHYLKWVDLWKLASNLIRPSAEKITAVHYFSAYATWLPDACARHMEYVKALETVGVTVKLGQFKAKRKSCKNCGCSWDGHEEKESDVNFAVELLHRSWKDEFDHALIVTADTDIVPVLEMIKRDHPRISLTAAIPEKRYGNAISLRNACHAQRRIKEVQLSTSLLPGQVLDANGDVIATRPEKYTPPPAIAEKS